MQRIHEFKNIKRLENLSFNHLKGISLKCSNLRCTIYMYLNHFLFVKDKKKKKVRRMLKGSVSVEDTRKGYLFCQKQARGMGAPPEKIFPKLEQVSYVKNGIQKGKREREGSLGRSLQHPSPLGLQLWKGRGTLRVKCKPSTALSHLLQRQTKTGKNLP